MPTPLKQRVFRDIGSLVKLASGKTRPQDIKKIKSEEYKFPVYGGNGIIGFSKDYLIDFKTIVIGRVGEYCGVIHNTSSYSWISDNALYVKEFITELNQKYLSTFLENIDLNSLQNKSSHPLITQDKVYNNNIPILNEGEINKSMTDLDMIERTILESRLILNNSRALLKSLINIVFYNINN